MENNNTVEVVVALKLWKQDYSRTTALHGSAWQYKKSESAQCSVLVAATIVIANRAISVVVFESHGLWPQR